MGTSATFSDDTQSPKKAKKRAGLGSSVTGPIVKVSEAKLSPSIKEQESAEKLSQVKEKSYEGSEKSRSRNDTSKQLG